MKTNNHTRGGGGSGKTLTQYISALLIYAFAFNAFVAPAAIAKSAKPAEEDPAYRKLISIKRKIKPQTIDGIAIAPNPPRYLTKIGEVGDYEILVPNGSGSALDWAKLMSPTITSQEQANRYITLARSIERKGSSGKLTFYSPIKDGNLPAFFTANITPKKMWKYIGREQRERLQENGLKLIEGEQILSCDGGVILYVGNVIDKNGNKGIYIEPYGYLGDNGVEVKFTSEKKAKLTAEIMAKLNNGTPVEMLNISEWKPLRAGFFGEVPNDSIVFFISAAMFVVGHITADNTKYAPIARYVGRGASVLGGVAFVVSAFSLFFCRD